MNMAGFKTSLPYVPLTILECKAKPLTPIINTVYTDLRENSTSNIREWVSCVKEERQDALLARNTGLCFIIAVVVIRAIVFFFWNAESSSKIMPILTNFINFNTC